MIRRGDILLFAVIRNEMLRLPEFLAHYRRLGIAQFLIVDNDSSDGSGALLQAKPDVSLWRTGDSYRSARFGMDWISGLLLRHGHGHWCLTVDADELLIYPDCEQRDLHALTAQLDARNQPAMGALMLELYPSGPIGQADAAASAPVTEQLPWFDPGPYRRTLMQPKRNRWVQGGARDRVFFADQPQMAPTLNKLPLVRWHWRYAYLVSTHSMLPPTLNDSYDGPGDLRLSGVLLHTKFLPDILDRVKEDTGRRQHFTDPDAHAGYYSQVRDAPVLRYPGSVRYRDLRQLVELGLMSPGSDPVK